MSSEWINCTLGDCVDVSQGLAINVKSKHLLVDAGLPLLRITDMFNDTYAQFVDTDKAPKKCIAEREDIIYTRTGQVGFVFTGKKGVVHNNCFKVEPIKPELTKKFVYWFLRQESVRDYANSIASGSVQKDLNHSAFKSIEFSYPSPAAQNRICTLLDSLDSRISLLRETNATLEAIAQALFKSWFVDFDPVHANAGTQAPSLPPEIQALFPATFTDSPQGPIPEGWEVSSVGEVIETVGGATPDTKNEEFWYPSEIAWTSPKDLSGLNTPVLLATERRISQKGLAKISSGLLPKGTLLMSSRAPIGYLAIAQIPLAINQGYIAMPPGGYLPPLYMLFWCRTNMELIENRANGSTFMEISKKAFKPIELIVPPIEIIDQFMSNATPLFEKLIENEQQAQNLESLRDTLLPRLISGQLRLPEAQAAIEEMS